MYLGSRIPLLLNYNPFMMFSDPKPIHNSQVNKCCSVAMILLVLDLFVDPCVEIGRKISCHSSLSIEDDEITSGPSP